VAADISGVAIKKASLHYASVELHSLIVAVKPVNSELIDASASFD
jgi:hypothetical protein